MSAPEVTAAVERALAEIYPTLYGGPYTKWEIERGRGLLAAALDAVDWPTFLTSTQREWMDQAMESLRRGSQPDPGYADFFETRLRAAILGGAA